MSRFLRLFLYPAFGLILSAVSASSSAVGSLALALPANVAAASGGFVTAAGVAFDGAAFNSGLTGQVAGKVVTVPAKWRLAANAGQFAVAAVKLNPTRFVVGVVASWLLEKGIKWSIDHWAQEKAGYGSEAASTGYTQIEGITPVYSSPVEGARAVTQAWFNSMPSFAANWKPGAPLCAFDGGGYTCAIRVESIQGGSFQTVTTAIFHKVLNYYNDTTMPVTDTSWASAAASLLSDAVASALSANNVKLPLDKPVLDEATIKKPLSDKYWDPLTKSWKQQEAVISPTQDSTKAPYVVVNKNVNADGSDAVDPATGKEIDPEKETDPCVENPNRLECLDMGEPDDNDLKTENKDFSITPVSGFGSDNATCPADRHHFLKSGVDVVFSFSSQCQMATAIRPAVIGFAWLSAILIFLGIGRKYGE